MFIFLFILALVSAFFWVRSRYTHWDKHGFLSVKPSFPFGNLSGVGYKMTATEKFDQLYKELKGQTPIMGIYAFLSPTLMPIDPEAVKNILVRDFSSFTDRGFYYNKKDDPLSASILTVEGPEWKELRTKLSPTFTSGKMKMMFEIVNVISERFVEVVGKETQISNTMEMREFSAKYTNDVIGNVAFGIEPNCLMDSNSEFRKYGKRLIETTAFVLLKFFFTSGAPELSRKLGLVFFDKSAANYFMKIFKETFALREQQGPGVKRHDFLELLLQFKETNKNDGLTVEELAANAFLFYTGGFETSSTTITFTLYELALNQDIQDRLRDEINENLENDGNITYEKLMEMKYLDIIIKEILRKYPPIPTTTRQCTKEYHIPNTKLVIPVGVNVQIPIYSFHHDEEYFPNPSKFDPERFNDKNRSKINMSAYLPFGDGPRNCLGLRFGLMQIKLGIAKLIKNYQFSVSNKTTIPMKFVPSSFFLTPVNNMWLTVKKV